MKRRVLLVEDNEHNRYLATFLLERQGLEVIHAGNGHQGVEMSKSVTPDVIVMDIQMPELDGYEAARLIKQQPSTAHIPIIGVSSFAMAGDRARALQVGFADYIEKPYDPEVFTGRILAHLSQSSSMAPS